jgi:hypothetical protein
VPCILPFLTDGCSEKYFMKLTGNRDIDTGIANKSIFFFDWGSTFEGD